MECVAWVDDFIGYISAERAYSDATVSHYTQILRDFGRFCLSLDEGLTWDTIDEDIVRQWVATSIEEGAHARTVKSRLTALRSFYRYLKLVGRITRNPMTRVPSPKVKKPLPKFFRDEDVNTLLDRLQEQIYVADTSDNAEDNASGGTLEYLTGSDGYGKSRAYLIILMLYMTGMRISEMVGLDVADIDLGLRQLRVTGKRNKQRVIPIEQELLQAIERYLPIRNAELMRCAVQGASRRGGGSNKLEDGMGALFLGRHGQRINTSTLRKLVCDLTGTVTTQRKRSPHVFRHTFATSMINQGSDLQSVKEILGHVSLSTTEVYTHTNFEELRRIYNGAHPRG